MKRSNSIHMFPFLQRFHRPAVALSIIGRTLNEASASGTEMSIYAHAKKGIFERIISFFRIMTTCHRNKFTHLLLACGLLSCLFSCTKDEYEPYTPTEWQYDKYSDSGISPGDDFYRYVCGKGIDFEGSDSWAPFSRWAKQQIDYTLLAMSENDDNPVPVLKRLNKLKNKLKDVASYKETRAEALAAMRDRLNGIEERTKEMDFPEKTAEYYKNGYIFFIVNPMPLSGHKFGINVTAVYQGNLQEWTEGQLDSAGIKDKFNKLLPKARIFVKYISDNIKNDNESVSGLNAGISDECKKLNKHIRSFANTKGNSSALDRFALALGNRNPDFFPQDSSTSKYFELLGNITDAHMKEAADAYFWCEAASFDLDIIFNTDTQINFLLNLLYPNLPINMSHTFCDTHVDPQCEAWGRGIFEALQSTMAERIDQSDWMTPYTKVGARTKIDAMECHTGILDWSKYEADMPVSDDYCSAMHEIGASYVSKLMAISGENTDLDHIIASIYMSTVTGVPAYAANSFYLPNANAMCILPSTSILMDMSPEFPFLTYIIGHEMCHGFDANGANYNERGELFDWWSINDRLEFKKKQDQLIGIFSQYNVGGNVFCKGANTITEDMADLGGMEIAYRTTVKKLEKQYRGEELLEMKRRFFKSYAILWAKYSSTEEKVKLIEEDVHSLNEFRVNGIVNNIDEWYSLYDVTKKRKFYLSPERRVHLW